MSITSETRPPEEWAALFYMCGHYDRPGEQDPFLAAFEEIRRVAPSVQMSAAVYLDLESGAQRLALRAGEQGDPEYLGAVNSGAPETFEQFLAWAFDACPARQYILVLTGLGILDAKSVVGRPPFDSDRIFAICDDRATDDALELHELSASLKAAFQDGSHRRLVMLACDMYAMQFMEVAYELRGMVDVLLGIQPDERHQTAPIRHWPYARLLQLWQTSVGIPLEGAKPRWRTGIDPRAVPLGRQTIELLSAHYASGDDPRPVTVSAVNLQALGPLAQALDTFSVVYLQWLSNDVIWRARETVLRRHMDILESAWSYDLYDVARSIQQALQDAAAEAVVRWAAETIPGMAYPRLSGALRILGAAARDLGRGTAGDDSCRRLAGEIAACRWAVERVIAVATNRPDDVAEPVQQSEVDRAVLGLFVDPDQPERVREAAAWERIVTAARDRFTGTAARELRDAFDGIDASRQLIGLAGRVTNLTCGSVIAQQPAIIDVRPREGRCGLSLYRPIDLNKLAQSNYLQLRFSRELHWTALLTAIDLIKHHARMLWRLLESQLTAAPLEARYQLMRRLAGDRALTGRHADQLQVLSAPHALFLTIEPTEGAIDSTLRDEAADRGTADPVTAYCVRLTSLDRSSLVVEHRNPVTRERFERLLDDIDAIGGDVDAPPADTVRRLARLGSLLGDDLLYGVSDRLADVEPVGGRVAHLVLQMPRELMRFPWELLRDRRGWLVERFAIGRQVIAEGSSVSRWTDSGRHGPLRLLVVAPRIEGAGAELAGVGTLEGLHVAACFERLEERLPGLVEACAFSAHVDTHVTVDDFRNLVRDGGYDIVHFAGHGRYDPATPDRSCWLFSDGPLYAFELRHTLANARVLPWLVYGSACEGARDGVGHRFHDGLYGMASAALGRGVAAYVGPLWRITETDAKNLAAAFYEALLLRRASIGEALALARRSVKRGQPDLEELVIAGDANWDGSDDEREPQASGWTGMVLYGDPTPTVLQRLSPSEH